MRTVTIPRSVGRTPIGSNKTKRCLKNCVKHCLIEIKQTKVCCGLQYIISSKSYCQILQKSIYQSLGKYESHLSCMVNFQASSIIKNILSESPLKIVFWWRFSYLATTRLSFTRSSSTKHLRANKVEVKTSYPNWHCHPGIWSLKTWDQSSCRLLGTTIDYTHVTVYVGCGNLKMLDIYHIHTHCLSHRHHNTQFFDRRLYLQLGSFMSTVETFEDILPKGSAKNKNISNEWNDVI